MTGLRRRLDDAGTMGYVVVVAAAALLAVASVVVTASPGGFVDVHIALAFGAFIALGELVRITLPGGRDAAPIATAGALGYVLLTRYPDGPATQSALQVVAVVVVAMLVGVAPHAVVGRAPSIDSLARRLLSVGFAAAIFRGSGLDAEVNTLEGRAAGVHHGRRRPRHARRRRGARRCRAGRRGWRAVPRGAAQRDPGAGRDRLGHRRHRRADRAGRQHHGLLGPAGLRRAAAAHPVLVPSLRGDPGVLAADDPRAVAGHRARRLHRDRALAAGQPDGRRRRP